MARWGGHRWLRLQAAGLNKVFKSKLRFTFDVVFDFSNNNEKLPIPLVEILLGTTVYIGEESPGGLHQLLRPR